MWDDIMTPIPVSDTSSSEDESDIISHEADQRERQVNMVCLEIYGINLKKILSKKTITTEQAQIHFIFLLSRKSSSEGATNLGSRKQPSASNNSISMCSSGEENVAGKEKRKRRKGEKVHNITNEIIRPVSIYDLAYQEIFLKCLKCILEEVF